MKSLLEVFDVVFWIVFGYRQEILLEQLESFGCLGATLVREAAAEYSFDSSLDDEDSSVV